MAWGNEANVYLLSDGVGNYPYTNRPKIRQIKTSYTWHFPKLPGVEIHSANINTMFKSRHKTYT